MIPRGYRGCGSHTGHGGALGPWLLFLGEFFQRTKQRLACALLYPLNSCTAYAEDLSQ